MKTHNIIKVSYCIIRVSLAVKSLVSMRKDLSLILVVVIVPKKKYHINSVALINFNVMI